MPRLAEPELLEEDLRHRGVPVLSGVHDDLLDPGRASAAESGADLMNCGRLPTTVRIFIRARVSDPPSGARW